MELAEKKEFLAGVGERIRKIRKSKGWTTEKLAEATGVSIQTIRLIEKGERSCRIETIFAIAKSLCISTDYLLDLEIPNSNSRILLLTENLTSEEKKFVEKIIVNLL